MVTDQWIQLVQQIDQLIQALRSERSETKKWRMRAIELERLKLHDERALIMNTQEQGRELERLRKEKKKMLLTVDRLVKELELAEQEALEKSIHD